MTGFTMSGVIVVHIDLISYLRSMDYHQLCWLRPVEVGLVLAHHKSSSVLMPASVNQPTAD
jgi:hypothetical protein